MRVSATLHRHRQEVKVNFLVTILGRLWHLAGACCRQVQQRLLQQRKTMH